MITKERLIKAKADAYNWGVQPEDGVLSMTVVNAVFDLLIKEAPTEAKNQERRPGVITKKDVEREFAGLVRDLTDLAWQIPLPTRGGDSLETQDLLRLTEAQTRVSATKKTLLALVVDDGPFVEVLIGGTDECFLGKLIPLNEVEKAVTEEVVHWSVPNLERHIHRVFDRLRNPPKVCPHCGQEVKGEKP